jgi:uncharacterized protein RhaS with RHS repeats
LTALTLHCETDPDGTTEFGYDAFKRPMSTRCHGIATLYQHDAGGRVVAETDALGAATTPAYSADAPGRTVTTSTLPDGATRIDIHNQDGTLQQLAGTAVHPVRHE